MGKKKHQQESEKIEKPPKKYKFYLGSKERYIIISSDFDSGNIALIRQISEFQYRLASIRDGTYTDHQVNSKSWFHFSVTGFPNNTRGKFFVSQVQTLLPIYYSKYTKYYRPVYKVGQGEWKRLETQVQLVMRENSQLQCVFQFSFKKQEDVVYFAFCYPFSYSDNINFIRSLNDFLFCDQFYFYKEILIHSPEGRQVHLLTITSYDHQDKVNENEELFDEKLFPEKARPLRFKKPVVLISARVHPGETPASYTMKGVINFLTSKTDLRAHLLRKMFVFMIVPMINVDGVYHGHFRMDIQGKNLNRFYAKPSPTKQPAIYAIKELAEHLNQDNRLSFYFDLHAHNAKKGCFIYGNAINDFVEQVESQVFCKLISLNNKIFEYQYCNFTQKQMNAKDRNEDLTKEGCGRVVMYRLAKILHSYSVECGIMSANKLNILPNPQNEDFVLEDKKLSEDPFQNNQNSVYKSKNDESPFFTPGMYESLGKNLLVSILDVFDKNPYNRIYNSKYKSMDMLRRLTAFEIFHEAERFRMFERFIFGKVKKINELIRQVLNTKLHYKQLYNFYFYHDNDLKNVKWPPNVPGLSRNKSESPQKSSKKSGVNRQYSESFLKALQVNHEEFSPDLVKMEEQIIENSEDNSSQSSQSIVYSPEKRIPSIEEELFLEELSQEEEGQEDLTKSQFDFPNQEISLKLKGILDDPEFMMRKRQNPSVRVRKIIKQETTFKSDPEIQAKKQFEGSQTMIKGEEIRKSIYTSIKEQIKMELKKAHVLEKKKMKMETSDMIIQKNMFYPAKFQKQRIKSWTMKKSERNEKGRKKVELPSLGSQMYIISTSTKTFERKA